MTPHPAPCDLTDTGKPIIDLLPGEATLHATSRQAMQITMEWLRGYKRASKRVYLVRAAGWCRYWVWRAI